MSKQQKQQSETQQTQGADKTQEAGAKAKKERVTITLSGKKDKLAEAHRKLTNALLSLSSFPDEFSSVKAQKTTIKKKGQDDREVNYPEGSKEAIKFYISRKGSSRNNVIKSMKDSEVDSATEKIKSSYFDQLKSYVLSEVGADNMTDKVAVNNAVRQFNESRPGNAALHDGFMSIFKGRQAGGGTRGSSSNKLAGADLLDIF